MKKRLLALLLVLLLAFTCLTACGDDDDDDKKDDDKKNEESGDKGKDEGKDDVSYKDIYEILDKGFELKVGESTFTVDGKISGEQSGTVKMTVTSKSNGKDAAMVGMVVDADVNGQKVAMNAPELICVVDKVAYINLAAVEEVAETAAGVDLSTLLGDVELAWFAIPLPDDMPEQKAVEGLDDTVMQLVKAMFAGAETTGKDNSQGLSIKNAAGMKTMFNALADFFEKDAKTVFENLQGASADVKIDLNAYVEKLVDFYEEDIVAIMVDMGMDEATAEAMAGSITDSLGETDLNEIYDQVETTTEEIDFAAAAKELREMADTVSDETLPKDFETGFTATLEDKKLTIDGIFKGDKDGEAIDMTFKAAMEEKSVSISAPTKQCYVRDFSDLIAMLISMNNMEDMEDMEDMDDFWYEVEVDQESTSAFDDMEDMDDFWYEVEVDQDGTSAFDDMEDMDDFWYEG